eukprot:5282141-Pyramimonas_sp.AAC.1
MLGCLGPILEACGSLLGRLGWSETRTGNLKLLQTTTGNQWCWPPRALQEELSELSRAVWGASCAVLRLSSAILGRLEAWLLYTSPSPRDRSLS